jgi:RimJ/RimL family protein N-acetyltransferase
MIAVREMKRKDAESIVRYFHEGTPEFHKLMGVDRAKLPSVEDWTKLILDELSLPPEKKQFFYVIWLFDGKPIGHSNINKIVFGQEAYMHLHLWKEDRRHQGMGSKLVRLSLPYYFSTFRLNELFCETHALNPAPNMTLERTGFELIKEYETIPGWINFSQPVKRWRMSKNGFLLSRYGQ